MLCSHCGTRNPEGAARCQGCDSSLDDFRATLQSPSAAATSSSSPESPAPVFLAAQVGALPVGFALGSRYVVAKMIGHGGMGAVYRVHDRELSRDVALKVIRPEIAEEPQALERFRREINLASSVTHRNVLRVYDLGEANGVRFLTMQYVEGEDLAHLIRREGRLPMPRVLEIFRQICEGLAAAHERGVVHRDLKPQNVMVEPGGAVYLTDFGLAKTVGDSGLTEAGALLGTPHYMSPEQVKAQPVDRRSDIYSLGAIFYELLAGSPPFRGGSAYEIMMQRLSQPPRPVGELNPEVPPHARGILERCLATDPLQRYQSVSEILADLDAGQARPAPSAALRARWTPAVVAVLGVLTVGTVLAVWHPWRWRAVEAPAAREPVSVLIADFDNETGDPIFDSTLEPALGVALEGASFVTCFNRASARRVAAQLQPGTGRLDEPLARLVAGREGVTFVATGVVANEGRGYSISVRTLDAITGNPVSEVTTQVAGKQEVLAAVTKLAAGVRKSLGDATPESAQIAAAETFTAASLEAAHAYALAQEAQWAGRWDDAIAEYSKTIELDPNLGRAYAGIALVEHNRGRRQEAEQYFREAMARIDRMSEREKYRTRGAYYLAVSRNPDNAIEELGALVEKYPADSAGLANLAVAYHLRRDFRRALEEGRRAVALSPTNVIQRNNVGLFALYAGDFEAAETEQLKVIDQNPSFVSGYAGLALARFGAGDPEKAAQTWARLEKLGPDGFSAATAGRADLALYHGQADEALEILEPGLAKDLEAGNPEAAAVKLTMKAEALLLKGRKEAATAAAKRALELSRTEVLEVSAARVLLAAGDAKGATDLGTSLSGNLDPESRMWGLVIRGEVELARGAGHDAVETFREAQKLVDAWPVRLGLGRAYLAAEAYTEAYAQFELCEKRRGETSDVFLSLVPTWHWYPPVNYYLGRAREGLGSHEAARGAYQAFLEVKSGGVDPLVADCRRRLATK